MIHPCHTPIVCVAYDGQLYATFCSAGLAVFSRRPSPTDGCGKLRCACSCSDQLEPANAEQCEKFWCLMSELASYLRN